MENMFNWVKDTCIEYSLRKRDTLPENTLDLIEEYKSWCKNCQKLSDVLFGGDTSIDPNTTLDQAKQMFPCEKGNNITNARLKIEFTFGDKAVGIEKTYSLETLEVLKWEIDNVWNSVKESILEVVQGQKE